MTREKVERKDVFWYIILRLIILTSILVSAVIIQFAGAAVFSIVPIFYLILVSYLVSAIFLLFFSWGKHYGFQAYMQILFDLLLITAFVHISGGITSSTYFLYVLAVMAASLVVSARAAYLTASLSAILFGLLVDGTYFHIIPYFSPEHAVRLSLGSVLFTMFIAWGTFFVIAFLMNYLSGNLKKARAELLRAQKELIIKERLAEAGRVSATLAHEIRNPLAAISGSVQVLKNDLRLDGEQKELMDIVVRESERVSQSIDQFLDFASPVKPVFSEVDLSGLLDETLKMLRGSGELNGAILVTGNYAESGVRLFASANQFKQVFWNLAKNAIKAMPNGGELTIDLMAEKKTVKIAFSDTGAGMTDEDKAHIFEPFYSGFENGRGLGMANVRRIIDDYDGTIEVNSELSKGTEILITLPLKKA
ncbi:MAG: ATP-binding protein [Candidatus Aminicenantes bacterium]|nr:ATP-binding protein [Candidatus Aminicenantes bacterium]